MSSRAHRRRRRRARRVRRSRPIVSGAVVLAALAGYWLGRTVTP